jgi:NAD-dependent dihydropyrimidine dehydrogenase PreA subunit
MLYLVDHRPSTFFVLILENPTFYAIPLDFFAQNDDPTAPSFSHLGVFHFAIILEVTGMRCFKENARTSITRNYPNPARWDMCSVCQWLSLAGAAS